MTHLIVSILTQMMLSCFRLEQAWNDPAIQQTVLCDTIQRTINLRGISTENGNLLEQEVQWMMMKIHL